MEGLQIDLCGEPRIRYEGKPWPFPVTQTCWVVLAMLATNERPTPRELLAVGLWPEYARVDGLANLRRHVHMIARALPSANEPWILSRQKMVSWNHAAPATIDVVEFERLLAEKRDAEAVERYRGDLLPLSFEDAIVAKRERLRVAYLDALERLIGRARAARDFARALEYAERLLTSDEWREEAVREWMAAKYESGDGSAALAMYERLAKRLQDEFSAAPMPQTTDLRSLISAGLPLPKSAESTIEREAGEASQRGWKPPFVGRAEPLERLTALWSRAARGSGGVAFISGEAGIGKSRLASELASLAREHGGRVLVGTTSNPESEPYEAVVVALRSALDGGVVAIGDVWLAALAQVIPEIHGLREGLAHPASASIDGAREQLFEAIVRSIEHLGRRQPLCLVLEDLHWAGPGTIGLVAALARRVGTLPVAILATYRNEEAAGAGGARALRASLVHERRAIACPLECLEDGDVSAIVGASVGDASLALCESVASLSEGNPLFVAQIVANYLETGSPPSETPLPGGVGEAIAARFRLLDAKVRAVAEMAATIGESFRAEVLAAAGGWEENAVLDALGSLMDRGIVRESGGGLDYVFAHALFATTLYSESSPEQLAARHRRIAAVLERDLTDDSAVTAGSVARHWKLAGEAERAGRLYVRAARAALRLYARGDAIAFAREGVLLVREPAERFDAYLLVSRGEQGYGDAGQWKRDIDVLCDLASGMGPEERFAALEQREAYCHQVGDRRKQRAAIDAMLELTERGLSPQRRIASLSALGKLHAARSQLPEAVERLQEALQIALESSANDDAFVIRERLVHAYGRLGRFAEASAEIDAMREAMRDEPSHQREIFVLRSELTYANSRQAVADGQRVGERLATIARETGDLESEIMARIAQAWAAQFDSDVPTVREHYDVALELAERLGYTKGIVSLLMDRGSFEHRIGNARESVAFYDRANAHATALAQPTTIAYCLVNRAAVQSLDGGAEEALASAREACEVASRAPAERRLHGATLAVLAGASIAGGDAVRGLEVMAEAIEIRREVGDSFGLADDLAVSATALLALQRDDEAAPMLEELRAIYEANPKQFEYPVRTCHLLSVAASKRGDEREARLYCRRGAELLARELARAPDDEAKATLERRPFNRAIRALLGAAQKSPKLPD